MPTLGDPIRRSRSMSMTPMIDVVFLLLIFFMLINTFGMTQMLRFATPAGERKSAQQDFNLTAVYVRAGGQIDLNGKSVTAAELKPELQKIKSAAAEVTLMVVAEPKARIQELIYVIEVARDAGLRNIALKKLKDAEVILKSRSSEDAND